MEQQTTPQLANDLFDEFFARKLSPDQCSEGMNFGAFTSKIYLPFACSRKRSWKTEVSLIQNHLLPAFEHRLLNTIEAFDIIRLQTSLVSKGYKPGSINRITLLLKVIINTARRWKVTSQPSEWAADAPELPDHEFREKYLTTEQALRLINVCLSHDKLTASHLVLALLFTGARKSELLFASWDNLDIASKTLRIPLSKSGKTRYLYLSDEALQIFSKQRLITGPHFIFSEANRVKPISSVSKIWQDIKSRAGLDDYRLHDLRHSFASFAISNGVSIYEVQKLLGHANTKTTMRYAHLSNRQLLEATAILPGVLH